MGHFDLQSGKKIWKALICYRNYKWYIKFTAQKDEVRKVNWKISVHCLNHYRLEKLEILFEVQESLRCRYAQAFLEDSAID